MIQFLTNSYSVNNLPNPEDQNAILKYIEKIGRVCYKSEDKITDGSALKFVGMLRDRKHWAVLEHFMVTIRIADAFTWNSYTNKQKYRNMCINPKLEHALTFLKFDIENPSNSTDDKYTLMPKKYVTGSITAFNNVIDAINSDTNTDHKFYYDLEALLVFLHCKYPDLIIKLNDDFGLEDAIKSYKKNSVSPSSEIGNRFKILSYDEMKRMPINFRMRNEWMSVNFILERSSTHDLVRHRPASFAQESTRYCNYGNKGFTFIIPCQFNEVTKKVLQIPEIVNRIIEVCDEFDGDPLMATEQLLCRYNVKLDHIVMRWIMNLYRSSKDYEELINAGWSAQEAKSVLPQALKAEINITASLQEWHHIFDMRASKRAYPQIQEVMYPLLGECINEYPGIFDDLKDRYREGGSYC